jgi:hypothetical protein
MKMKKWMGIIIMTAVAVFTFTAQATVVDEWDMNGNGLWQNSNNGLNLGAMYKDANQAVAQVADDGTFFFSPSPAYDADGSKFGGTGPLSSTNSLVDNVIRLSWSYTAMDWTTSAAAAQATGFRIYNAAQAEFIGLEFKENSGKIWAYARSSANLGNLNAKTGRLINGLAGSGTPREVSVELDYANSEIRVYAGAEWDYSANGTDGVFTYAVDFATAGVTDIGAFQTYFNNWGATNVTTMNNLRVEILPVQSAQSDVHIVSQLTAESDNTPSTNNFSFYANEGDMVVVMSASNKGADPLEGSVTFSGGATLGETVYSRRNNGPTPQYWYVPVLGNGTVNAELITVNGRSSMAAYQLRGIIDEGVVVLAEAKSGIGSEGATSVTNNYAWEESDSGIFLEAFSSYGTDGTPLNPATVVDVINSTDNRIVAHGTFSSTNELANIWTHTTLTNVAIVGLAVRSDRIPETDDLVTYQMNDPAGTDIKDLEQVGIDDNSFSGIGDGIQADGAGSLVYSNCAAVAYRTHDFEKDVTNGVIMLEFKVSEWDYTGMPDGTSISFSLINTNNNEAAKIGFDFKPIAANGTRIAFVGEGDSDYNAKLNVTNGTDVAMRLRIDLDNDQFDAQYNTGSGWVTQSITNDLGFTESVVNRLQLIQNTAAWVAGAYVKVEYVRVVQASARLIDFQLDDEVGTLFGQAYNPGTWEGAAWNFNGPWATDGAGNLRFDLTQAAGGSTRKFLGGTSLSNGVVNARWSVPAWDFLDGDGAMGVQWQLRDTNSATGVKIQFDQNGTTDKTRVRAIDPLGAGAQTTFASGTLTNSTDGVDFRVRLDLDEGTMAAYWRYSTETSWTLIDETLTNGVTQLDEIWAVSTAPTGAGDAGFCDYDYFIVDYTPAVGVTVIPTVTAISISGSTVSLTWDSETGVSYDVLSKAALTDPTWATKATGISGAGASTSTDVTGSGTEEFYTIEAYTP